MQKKEPANVESFMYLPTGKYVLRVLMHIIALLMTERRNALFLGPHSFISVEGLHTELSEDLRLCFVSGQISANNSAAQSLQSPVGTILSKGFLHFHHQISLFFIWS